MTNGRHSAQLRYAPYVLHDDFSNMDDDTVDEIARRDIENDEWGWLK